jgi:hypothetical protein
MAKAMLFLVSDDCSYCTGMELVCDGGMTQLANRWPAKKQLGPNSRYPL